MSELVFTQIAFFTMVICFAYVSYELTRLRRKYNQLQNYINAQKDNS